jgi:hypothetical protein
MTGELDGPHWRALRALLPLYQAITTVGLGDGATTSFWFDVWLDDDCLADRYPAFLTHCIDKNATVRTVIHDGLRHRLVPRLTPLTQAELAELESAVAGVALSDEADTHLSPLMRPDRRLLTGALYHLLVAQDSTEDAAARFVWDSATPPRVRFFGCLLSRDRIQSKKNLLVKNVVNDATCDFCCDEDESAAHIIFGYPFARSFWSPLGFCLPVGQTTQDLHQLPRPSAVPSANYSRFVLLCCWQLWKRRNNYIFRRERACSSVVTRAPVAPQVLSSTPRGSEFLRI